MLSTRLAATLLLLAVATSATASGSFVAPEQESASTVIAADSSGRLHIAFTGYDGEAADVVTYRVCEARCEDTANWHGVALPIADPVTVQIATTPQGQPRLLIASGRYAGAGVSRTHFYGACDDRCTEIANWSIVPVATAAEHTLGGLFRYRLPEHSFTVDDQGRPWFVLIDANYLAEPDNYGTFLLTCETACIDPENWTETNVAVRIPDRYVTEYWDQVALAVAPGGHPRLLGKVYALDEEGKQVEDGEGLSTMSATPTAPTAPVGAARASSTQASAPTLIPAGTLRSPPTVVPAQCSSPAPRCSNPTSTTASSTCGATTPAPMMPTGTAALSP